MTFKVLKDRNSNDSNLEQHSNIPCISVTFSVLNEDKSSFTKEEHPPLLFLPNINDISVTFSVLNEDKLIVVNEEKKMNIPFILVTFCVLNEDKFIVVNEEQKANMPFILVFLRIKWR